MRTFEIAVIYKSKKVRRILIADEQPADVIQRFLKKYSKIKTILEIHIKELFFQNN